jgi:acylphosphatase
MTAPFLFPITASMLSELQSCFASSMCRTGLKNSVRPGLAVTFSLAMSDLETRRFVVTGRVQGVGFRWFVEREAAILCVTGWVRNRDNGSVEVMATGTREQLAALHGRLREGPRAARVDDVAVSPAPLLEAKSFGIEGAW